VPCSPPEGRRARRSRPASHLLALAAIPFIALALARFAYAAVLPAMQADLGWSTQAAAVPATANGLGYLVGATTAGWWARRVGGRAIEVSLAVTTLAIAATACTPGLVGISVVRGIAGVSGGWAFVLGAAVAARWRDEGSPAAPAWYAAGAGAGIACSAGASLLVGPSGEAWRASWLAFAAVAALLTTTLAVTGFAALGPAAHPASSSGDEPAGAPARRAPLDLRLATSYLLFGAGYIVFATFSVAELADRGVGTGGRTAFWLVVGLAAVAAVPAWRQVQDQLVALRPVSVPLVVCAVAVAAFVAGRGVGLAVVAGAAFGGSFLAVTAGVTIAVQRDRAPSEHVGALAGLTTWFAVGQLLGPALVLVGASGSVGLGPLLIASAVLLAAGAAVAWPAADRDPELTAHR
jgi:predicted MFS family arabinose efflux permease